MGGGVIRIDRPPIIEYSPEFAEIFTRISPVPLHIPTHLQSDVLTVCAPLNIPHIQQREFSSPEAYTALNTHTGSHVIYLPSATSRGPAGGSEKIDRHLND